MKVRGQKVAVELASELIVFPRENGDIAFRATAVIDRSEFDRLCPSPLPPKKRIRGNRLVDDYDSPKYAAAQNEHNKRYFDWLAITCLAAANLDGEDDEIEWETVDKLDASTWGNWLDEFRDAGFSEMERNRILNAVITANSLSESRLDEARQSFLAGPAEDQNPSSSPSTEQSVTPPGEPASD